MSEPEEPPLPEIASLPKNVEPPARLEKGVIVALRDRGLIGAGRRSPSWALLVAASLAALVVGWVGRGLLPFVSTAAVKGEFALLLAEPRPLRTDKATAALVAEYRAWATRLTEQGTLVRGAKLAWEGRRLASLQAGEITEDREPRGRLAAATGLFMVRARDLDEALAIARTCPHLAYGGEVSVRPVERTRPPTR